MNQLQVFNGNQVEVFELDGVVYFNPKHVCACLDITDSNDAIKGFNEKQKVKLKNSDAGNNLIRKLNNAGENFLTESGVYKLIFKSRKPDAEKFQNWVTDEVLPAIRKTGSYSNQQSSQDVFAIEMNRAKIMSEMFAVDLGIAGAVAIKRVEDKTGEDLLEYKKLLPIAHKEVGTLNPTQIGKELGGLKPQYVNRLLQANGLQYKLNKDWRLTESGEEFAQEYPYSKNGHSGYQIRWDESVIDYLKNKEEAS